MFRYFIFWRNELIFWIGFTTASPLQGLLRTFMLKMMKGAIGEENHKLINGLIPEYEVGCKRITPSDGYLKGKGNRVT